MYKTFQSGMLSWSARVGGGMIAVAFIAGCSGGSAMNLAKKQEQAGDYNAAVTSYEQIATTAPGTPEARQAKLAVARIQLSDLKQTEQGVATYRSVVDSDPKSDEGLTAAYQLGLHYFRLEDFDNAATSFQGVINAQPTSETAGNAQLMLAKTYEKAGKLADAEQTYNAFSSLHAENPNAAIALETRAKLLDQLGNKTEAIASRQRIVREFGNTTGAQEVVELAKQGLQAEGAVVPSVLTPETMSDTERAQMRRENIRDRDRPQSTRSAAETVRRANIFGVNADDLMSSMNITTDEQGTMYDAMFSMATVMFLSEQYKDAGALYQRAIELAEEDQDRNGVWENLGPSYQGLASVYKKLGLNQLASQAMSDAMKSNPQLLDQIIDSGLVDYGSGDYERAIEIWQGIAGINPGKDGTIFYNIGLAYKHLKDTPSEVEAFEHAVAANPDDKDALQSLAEVLYYRASQRQRSYLFQDAVEDKGTADSYLEIGMLSAKFGYWVPAQSQFNIGARVAKNEEKLELAAGMNAMKAVAMLQRSPDKPEAAVETLQPALTAFPESYLVRYASAMFAQAKGDKEKAVAEYKKAISLKPRDSEPVRSLASFYLAQGDKAAALATYAAFMEQNPSNDAIRQAHDLLKLETTSQPTGMQ
ncbi:MAG: tetratricopeptide repeat protein [Candidatus Poribacteria bacterium]|nr:tetratricopeptide repeat protein [Candidatus Poribacteria bacterium]